jgi:hypothetical protein
MNKVVFSIRLQLFCAPNGSRYPLVGGTRQRQFDGNNSKPRKLLKNAQTPTSRVHAVLGGSTECQTHYLKKTPSPILLHALLPLTTDKHHHLPMR